MRTFIIRRLMQFVPVLILITMLVFSLLLAIPGDPVRALIGPGEALDPAQIRLLRQEYRLDEPMLVQYGVWLSKVMRGDLGRSNQTQRRVLDEVGFRALVTGQFGLVAWVLSVLIAVPAGILSAVYRGSRIDLLATVISVGGVAIPGFWLGILLILLFGVRLGWLPTQGFVSLMESPVQWLRHMALPAFSLGVTGSALIMRQTRSALLEVLAQDYVRMARAKGLSGRAVVWVHALRNALLPVVTIMGLEIGRIFAGAVVIETLFSIPGMGRLMVESVFQRDFPVVQASVLLMAVAVLIANFLTDVAYTLLDPRIKYD
jgi:peptide/nickel transport system permease protein